MLVSAVVVAFVAVTLDSDEAQFTAEAVDVSDEPINVVLDPGEFTRFLVDPSDVEVLEATLRYAGESSTSTAQLRLLGVDGQLGAEIAAASLKRVAAEQPAEVSAEGAPEPASQSLAAQETAVVRRTVIEADSSLVVEVASESGGNFVLTIAGTAGQGAPIPLRIDGDPVEAEIGAAGDVVTGSLQGAAADESVRVVVTPAEQFDAVVLVRTGSGTEVGFADLGSEGDDEVLTFTVPAADELLIEVSGYDGSTGGFVLAVETIDLTELEIGGPAVEGVIDGEIAAYTVRGSAGGAIRVIVSPQPGFDPGLRLVASDGSTSEVDDGGEGVDETLTAVIGADGTRVIEVLGYAGSTGEFSIAVAPIEVRPLGLDEVVSGTIDASRPFDTYRVTIPAETTIESFDVVGRDGLELSLEISTQFYGSVAFDMTDLIDEGDLDDMQALWQEVDFYDEEEWLVTVSGLRATSGEYDLIVTTAP